MPPLGCGVPIDGLAAGVANRGLRRGDSGRGKDGRDFLNCGLGARPGPTDWLNFGSDGVGGVNVFGPATLTLLIEDVEGVRGNELEDVGGDPRFVALAKGKKIPAPSIDVTKYETLYEN
jgi:hypothetical protein